MACDVSPVAMFIIFRSEPGDIDQDQEHHPHHSKNQPEKETGQPWE